MKIEGGKLPTFVRSRHGLGSVIVSASSVHESTLTSRRVSVIKVLMEDLLVCFLPARLMTRQAVFSQRLPLSMPVTASADRPRLGSLHLDRVTLFTCTAVGPASATSFLAPVCLWQVSSVYLPMPSVAIDCSVTVHSLLECPRQLAVGKINLFTTLCVWVICCRGPFYVTVDSITSQVQLVYFRPDRKASVK